jgi:hypothetical protein
MRDGGRHGAGEIAGSAAHITAHQGGQQDNNKWAQAIMIARGCSLRVSGDVYRLRGRALRTPFGDAKIHD